MNSTPKIVSHVFSEKSQDRKIVHNGIAYSVRAYQLLVVDQAGSTPGSQKIQPK